RTGPGSFRGPFLAGVSSPRLPGDAGLWVLGAGTTACQGGPGSAGDQKRPEAADHRAGDPPGPPTTPEADGAARMPVLQSLQASIESKVPSFNGVVLKTLRKNGRIHPCR